SKYIIQFSLFKEVVKTLGGCHDVASGIIGIGIGSIKTRHVQLSERRPFVATIPAVDFAEVSRFLHQTIFLGIVETMTDSVPEKFGSHDTFVVIEIERKD